MSFLIINADDLGVNPQRSHGILQCFEFGVVTSASLLPNGSDSDAAAKHAREKKLPCGLHLNLTSEYPLSKPEEIPGLTEMNGQFMGGERLWSAIDTGKVPRSSIEREVRAQIDWMFDAHGSMTHLSSNDHIHIHPLVADVLMPMLERYGVRFVRLPQELPLPPFGFEVPESQLEDIRLIGERASAVRGAYAAHGLESADHFRGLTLLGNSSLKNLRHILGKLPEGTTEMMVHPGSAITYGTDFDLDPQRQTELRMLLDSTIPDMLKERKIMLKSYADL